MTATGGLKESKISRIVVVNVGPSDSVERLRESLV